MQVRVQQLGPGMMQQIQSMCGECQGTGERIDPKLRCKKCSGKKVNRERKILEVVVDKGKEYSIFWTTDFIDFLKISYYLITFRSDVKNNIDNNNMINIDNDNMINIDNKSMINIDNDNNSNNNNIDNDYIVNYENKIPKKTRVL